jgi:hypothetical protein
VGAEEAKRENSWTTEVEGDKYRDEKGKRNNVNMMMD